MTPEQKAKELVEKFEPLCHKPQGLRAGEFGDFAEDYNRRMYSVKKAALICVEEILSLRMVHAMGRNDEYSEAEFYGEVKTHLEKL